MGLNSSETKGRGHCQHCGTLVEKHWETEGMVEDWLMGLDHLSGELALMELRLSPSHRAGQPEVFKWFQNDGFQIYERIPILKGIERMYTLEEKIYLCVCFCVHTWAQCAGPLEVRRGHWITWSWSFRQLWALLCGYQGPLKEEQALWTAWAISSA